MSPPTGNTSRASPATSEKEFEWIRRLLENQQEADAEDYIHSLKVDMFDDEVFVFTPKGKVISLPAGSTPIDFAYAIHSAVGNSMVGAKVNNRIAGYDLPLKNGDIVEVLTSKTAKGPSRDWLQICKSNQARSKIKQWFKKERREDNILARPRQLRGRAAPDEPAASRSCRIQISCGPFLKKNSFDCLDDMYAAIGYGGLTAVKAANRVRDDLQHATRAAREQAALESAPDGRQAVPPQHQRRRRGGHRLLYAEILPLLHPSSRR